MKLHKDIGWLRQQYLVDKKSLDEMATMAGVSHMTIYRELSKNNLIRKPRSWKPKV